VKIFLSHLLAAVLLVQVAQAASVYVYVNEKGSKLITDHPRENLRGYRLLKKYGIDDNVGAPFGWAQGADITPIRSEYDGLIMSMAAQFGLEPALIKAIIHVESAFNPNALSPKGAKGLMQLMPETAHRYGVNTREDPTSSVEGGSRYIRDLLTLFNDDTRLALAAYNAGESAVRKYNGIPPFRETQSYVEKVIRLRDRYLRH